MIDKVIWIMALLVMMIVPISFIVWALHIIHAKWDLRQRETTNNLREEHNMKREADLARREGELRSAAAGFQSTEYWEKRFRVIVAEELAKLKPT